MSNSPISFNYASGSGSGLASASASSRETASLSPSPSSFNSPTNNNSQSLPVAGSASTSPAPGGSQALPPPPPSPGQFIGDNFQPTVRVMRLYKPGFHLVHTLPVLPLYPMSKDGDMMENFQLDSELSKPFGAEFTLSSHLILPDSFGDIYLGEKFSAYVAIVNGYPQVPFHSVSLSVRLQTTTTVIDLHDIRPNNTTANRSTTTSTTYSTGPTSSSLTIAPILSFNDSLDVIVSHVLNELGTHTLRVSVQYTLQSNSNDVKTLRKFYRFNVLQPLVILSSFREVSHKPMVQCQVTNVTKSPIFVDDMSFVPVNKDAEYKLLRHSNVATEEDVANGKLYKSKLEDVWSPLGFDDIPLLLPDESMCFSFIFSSYPGLVHRIAGYPVVKYNNSMGESSYYRGEDTVVTAGYTPAALVPQPIKFILVHAPTTVIIGEEFEITLRLFNTTASVWPLRLDCVNNTVTVNSYNVFHNIGTSEDGPGSNQSGKIEAVEDPGMYFTGVTSRNLGSLDAGSSMEFTVALFAASMGLYDLPTVYAMHAHTKERYSSGKLCKILIVDTEN